MSDHKSPSYDDVPFPGLPVVAAQPERLAVLGLLRGLRPAAPMQARVLELGCGAAQNLLPLAERYPQATLVGVDQSARQIEAGLQAADDAGLANLVLRVADIGQLPEDLGTFDYIIAQAVYSWVDESTRDQLLAACRRHLTPQGLAYVSYNTYPGWHVHEMLRAAMLYDARGARTPNDMAGRARNLLGFLESSLIEPTPYNELVKSQVGKVLRQPDAYLLHDHLETTNQPVYFRQFAAHARRHELKIVGDGSLGIRAADRLAPEAESELSQLTSDPIEQEQYRDIVQNRTIRQTVLCHAAAELKDRSTTESFRGLYLEGSLKPEGLVTIESDEVARFVNQGGLRVSSGVPIIKAALSHLGEIWPNYIEFDALVAAALERCADGANGSQDRDGAIQRLSDNLRLCCLGGVVDVHSEPPSFATQAGERPRADALARQAAKVAEAATNRRHEVLRLEPVDRQVLQLLDGQHDQAAIVDALVAAAAQGRFAVFEHQALLHDAEQSRRVLADLVPRSLERLARNAFLIA